MNLDGSVEYIARVERRYQQRIDHLILAFRQQSSQAVSKAVELRSGALHNVDQPKYEEQNRSAKN